MKQGVTSNDFTLGNVLYSVIITLNCIDTVS